MENYIITNETVALIKNKNQTIIIDINRNRNINKSIKKVLDINCILHGSSLKGRIEYAKHVINCKYKIPIIISNNNIFLQINSFRNNDMLLISLNKIIDYKTINNSLLINCVNNLRFNCKISQNSFEKNIIKGILINNNLNYKKSRNFV